MRILNTNIIQYPVAERTVSRRNFENKFDTFEHTTNAKSPNFKGGIQDAYKKVLENPSAMQKVMNLISIAAVSLVAGTMVSDETSKKDSTENIENNPFMTLFLGNFFNQKINKDETHSSVEETETLKKENEELKNKINELEKIISEQNSTKETQTIEEPQTDKVKIQLPKRPGKKSHFETVVENITTDKDTADKLEKICKILLKDTKNKKALIKTLTASLESVQNDEELKNIINKNYKEIVEKAEEQKEIPRNENPINPKGIGIKIVDKIALTPSDMKRLTGENLTPESFIEVAHVGSDSCEGIPEVKNNQPTALDIGIGTPRKNLILNIQKLYNAFYKRKISEADKYINWSQHDGIGTTSTQLIKNEIIKEGNSYENINTSMAEELAVIINTNPYFQAFSLHGALRLIDRFVDFESFDKTPEAQAEDILNNLSNIIKKAIISEKYETYSYEETAKYGKKIYTGLRVVIDNGDNRTESERKYFGKEPISIAICQNRFAKREAIIHTLFN